MQTTIVKSLILSQTVVKMKWNEITRNINYLNFLLNICGLQPVFDRPKNGKKYSKLGILSICINTGLCIYSDYELEQDSEVLRAFQNGVLVVMSYLKRIFSFVLPIACIIGSIFQFESLATFLDLNDRFDVYLNKCSVDVMSLHLRIKKVHSMSISTSLFVAVISGISNYYFSILFSEVYFYTIYSGVFFSLSYTLIIFKVCNNYYAMYLRTDMYTLHLKNIMFKFEGKNTKY